MTNLLGFTTPAGPARSRTGYYHLSTACTCASIVSLRFSVAPLFVVAAPRDRIVLVGDRVLLRSKSSFFSFTSQRPLEMDVLHSSCLSRSHFSSNFCCCSLETNGCALRCGPNLGEKENLSA